MMAPNAESKAATSFSRTGSYAGLLVTLAVGGWFIMQARLGLAQEVNVADHADTGIIALLIAQAASVVLTIPLLDVGSRTRHNLPAITLLMLVPAPLLVVLWQSGTIGASGIVFAEIAILALALALASLVGGLDRWVARRLATVIANAAVLLLLVGLWTSRGLWPALLGL